MCFFSLFFFNVHTTEKEKQRTKAGVLRVLSSVLPFMMVLLSLLLVADVGNCRRCHGHANAHD
jgi:hypothetical protein